MVGDQVAMVLNPGTLIFTEGRAHELSLIDLNKLSNWCVPQHGTGLEVLERLGRCFVEGDIAEYFSREVWDLEPLTSTYHKLSCALEEHSLHPHISIVTENGFFEVLNCNFFLLGSEHVTHNCNFSSYIHLLIEGGLFETDRVCHENSLELISVQLVA